MPAVDAKQYSLSHFDNSDIWFEASYDLNTKTGWLGRWIDRNGIADNPLQAISIDTALSKSIRTDSNPVCAIPSLPMAGFTATRQSSFGGTNTNLNPQVARPRRRAGRRRQRLPRTLARDLRARLQHLRADQDARPRRPPTVALPEHEHALDAPATAAHLLAANLGTRVITIHWGGFDTHTNQLNEPGRADQGALARARRVPGRPEARGIEQRVATLVFSEFGRRVKETPDSAHVRTRAPTTARAA